LGSRVRHQKEEVEEVGQADEHHDDDVNGSSLRDGHLKDDLLNSEWPYLL
jgi:hypothetical protein